MGFFLRQASTTVERALVTLETPDMDSWASYIRDVGTFKHYCYVLSDFDWRKATDMYQNASMDELVELFRARFHYYKDIGED